MLDVGSEHATFGDGSTTRCSPTQAGYQPRTQCWRKRAQASQRDHEGWRGIELLMVKVMAEGQIGDINRVLAVKSMQDPKNQYMQDMIN
jgi:hypothetical protein